MFGILFLLLPVVGAYAVYVDATDRETEGAIWWALLTLVVGYGRPDRDGRLSRLLSAGAPARGVMNRRPWRCQCAIVNPLTSRTDQVTSRRTASVA
ncbi:hypothetical protein [Natrarchaeobaculum sulfurireducens]|uniref:Uncharacterized protein n=1 Tax=Natrarchaeobaculum sulfurireducens TaxID=2044521 RepID=A0A346PRW0_9EURY|nr:hypothetical protein [Natrarchaeobaculum sulfurireducens]AXR82255.1 hypothetical protein AArcMg_2258 [Natrarchaeobaculum sulfurireducens]